MFKNFKLNQISVEQLANTYGTPLIVLSNEQVKSNYTFLKKNLPNVKIYYAVKSNPDERLVKTLAQLGSCFDVASDGEMNALTSLGISSNKLLYANTVKTFNGMKTAKKLGITKFTYDSEAEILKMSKVLPGSTVLLRVRVENKDSHVDLNVKFGANSSDAINLLKFARENGFDVAGLCFHVGSQCTNSQAYIEGLKICQKIFSDAKKEGFNVRIIDIGGGFPISVAGENINIRNLLKQIKVSLEKYFSKEIEIWAEPGRFICGTTANLITRVIGSQIRNKQQWYFLDDGLYGTFSGIIFDHWKFDLISFKKGELISAVFAGPSCDSLDMLYSDVLTVQLNVNDLILVPACGAYTSASATVFNGFAKTKIIYWEDVKETINNVL